MAATELGDVRKRRTVKVTFDDGDTVTTDITGSMVEIRAYYVGQMFDHYPAGVDGREVLRKAVTVDELGAGRCPDGGHPDCRCAGGDGAVHTPGCPGENE